MVVKTPEFVIIEGAAALPKKKRASVKKPPLKQNDALASALAHVTTMAPPALLELVELLPRNEPYTPLVKALAAALKAYWTKREEDASQQDIDAVKKAWDQYVHLEPGDKRAAALKIKLDRAIAKL